MGARKNLIICCLLALFALQSFAAIRSKSATFDEVQYFGIGKYLLTEHKWDIMGAVLHPPLSYYLNSLPLLTVREDRKIWDYGDRKKDLMFLGAVDFYRGQELLSADFNKGDRMLIASRCMTLLLSLVLGLYVYRFGALLFGVAGGLISLLCFTFCPNMLAYSGIAVPDMPLTAFTFIAAYYLWRTLHEEGRLLPVFTGVSLGLALLSKFPAPVILPVFVVAAVLESRRQQRQLLPRLLIACLVAFLVMLAGYQGDLTPFIQGWQYRQMQLGMGQNAYLMGSYSPHGWWYFYPLTVLMKSPLPLLLLYPLAVVTICRNRAQYAGLLLVLLAPAGIYLAVFSFSDYSSGVRYLLPIYPFFFLTLGALATVATKLRYLLAASALWYVGSSLAVAPHYLAYFNEAFGGPANGYRFLADSNLDWGQDLKGLKKFMAANKIERISLSYFGADSPQRYGITYDWLPSHYLYNPNPDAPYDIYPHQLVAVSVTNLLGVYLENRDLYRALLQYEPVARIGYSIHVYDLSGSGRVFVQ